MQCPNCGTDIGIKREFCPACGKRVNVAFEQIAASVHVDAASRRGENLERFLGWGLMALIAIGVVIHGVNYLWDRPLVYDGADLPAIEAPVVPLISAPQLEVAYHDVFSLNLPPGQAPKVFANRLDPLKAELRLGNGGTAEVTPVIENGLKFLLGRQGKDGSWTPGSKAKRILPARDESAAHQWTRTGLTALALLAFLGEGHTWQEKETKGTIRHGKCVEQAIRFLVTNQDAANGRFGPAEGNFMYNHGLATLAIVEAAGLLGDPYLRESAQKGIDLIQRTQSPVGGWKYKDEISGNPDTSVTSWQVQALLTANEIGLKVDPQVLSKSLDFFKKVTEPNGQVRYDLQDRAAFSPSGVALMMRRWLGETDSGALRLLTRKTLEGLPHSEKSWGRGWKETAKDAERDEKRARIFDPYAWYFGTYGVFFQGGDDWKLWHSGPPGGQTSDVKVGLLPALLDLQDQDGGWYASDKWTVKVGEVYSTALCILALQAYYRIQ